MSDLIWKPICIGLLVTLFLVGGGTGAGWWLAGHDRDLAKADLAAERHVSDDLRAAVREQNRATEVLGKAKTDADARGSQALVLATANGKRFDLILAQGERMKATTCTEAMPTLNAILEGVR